MREELLNQVWQELEQRRIKNEQTEIKHLHEIEEMIPEIAALNRQRGSLIHTGLLGILQGDDNTADTLPEEMDRISAAIREKLKEYNYPEYYLAPVYTCGKCKDTGYTGEPVKEICTCVLKAYQEKLRKAIGLRDNGQETFDCFDETVYPDELMEGYSFTQRQLMRTVRRTCEEWADHWPQNTYRDLVLSGRSGLGKTFLLRAMASRLIERGCNVLLVSAYSFLEQVRKGYFSNSGIPEEFYNADVLLLDDLGSEPLMQNITIEQLFCLINERQNHGRSTVISTNLNMKELRERYTERIASRLADTHSCNFIGLIGSDVRNGKR